MILTYSLPQTNVSNDTTFPQGEHLCKFILKSKYKCRIYGPDKLIYVTFKCSLDLQPAPKMFQMALLLLKDGGGWVERRCWVNFQCWGVLLVWMIVGQGPIALAIGAGGGMFGHFFSHLSFLFSFSLSMGDGPI